MQISQHGLPKAILATFCCGGNKTSMGDAVGKDSFQIWAGGMEPQPAALRSEPGDLHHGGAGFVPPSPLLSVRERERCGLVSRALTKSWASHVASQRAAFFQATGGTALVVWLCPRAPGLQIATLSQQLWSLVWCRIPGCHA
uniref:Uncharacterized protein n=1 Tax=Aquila chrysaetos chrysaetos TaxID=223781 RepID=A0A663DJS5_AQUCH